LSTLLIGSHLAVGDVAAGQAAGPHRREEPLPYRPTAIARRQGPLGPARRPQEARPPGAPPVARFATPVGLRPPFVTHPATLPHPDRRALLILFAAQQACSTHVRP